MSESEEEIEYKPTKIYDVDFSNSTKSIVVLIIGRRNSGKTQLLLELMTNDLSKQFDTIHFFCPNFFFDEKYKKYISASPNLHLYKNYDAGKVQEIYEAQTAKGDDKVLCIFDDCIAEHGFKSMKNDDPLSRMVSNGRNRRISVMIVSQVYRGLPASVRKQGDYLFFFNTKNKMEMDAVYSEYGQGSRKEFDAIYNGITEEKYHVMKIDTNNDQITHIKST